MAFDMSLFNDAGGYKEFVMVFTTERVLRIQNIRIVLNNVVLSKIHEILAIEEELHVILENKQVQIIHTGLAARNKLLVSEFKKQILSKLGKAAE